VNSPLGWPRSEVRAGPIIFLRRAALKPPLPSLSPPGALAPGVGVVALQFGIELGWLQQWRRHTAVNVEGADGAFAFARIHVTAGNEVAAQAETAALAGLVLFASKASFSW
jgi:hypothetical protein